MNSVLAMEIMENNICIIQMDKKNKQIKNLASIKVNEKSTDKVYIYLKENKINAKKVIFTVQNEETIFKIDDKKTYKKYIKFENIINFLKVYGLNECEWIKKNITNDKHLLVGMKKEKIKYYLEFAKSLNLKLASLKESSICAIKLIENSKYINESPREKNSCFIYFEIKFIIIIFLNENKYLVRRKIMKDENLNINIRDCINKYSYLYGVNINKIYLYGMLDEMQIENLSMCFENIIAITSIDNFKHINLYKYVNAIGAIYE